MVAWSSIASKSVTRSNLLLKAFSPIKNELKFGQNVKMALNSAPIRSHNTMTIRPSRYEFNKFKDMFNLYIIVGALPLLLISAYCYIFIGPATLAVIPEGYEPKPWEYHKNPITRFFAKYVTMSPQEAHERNLHNIFYTHERYLIRQLETKIENLIKERQDYQAFFMSPVTAKYQRMVEEVIDSGEERAVQTRGWVK